MEEEKVEKEKLDDIIKKLSQGLEEVYAFYTLSKNPPETGFADITHNKVDIKEELLKIDTSNRSYYSFYQDFLKIFSKIKDGHTSITFPGLSQFTEKFYENGASVYFPVIFNIKNDTKGIPRMYCKPNKESILNTIFKKTDEIFKVINKSQEVPIKAIKGKNPFDFVYELITQFYSVRSPHGSFTLSFNCLNNLNLVYFPIYKENITDFKVEYENGDTFQTDLLFIFKENIFPKHQITQMESIKNYFLNPRIFDKMVNDFIFIPELKELPYKLIEIDKFGRFKFDLETNINSIKGTSMTWKDWNYSTSDNILKCRVDKENNLNVYLIRSFHPKNPEEFIETVEECSNLFDKNDNKIILIHSLNGGGYVVLSEFLLEIFSPYTSINLYTTIRATQAIKNDYRGVFQTIDKCEDKSQVDFFKSFQKVKYADEEITNPFIIVDKRLREKSRELRKKMKKKRKPTDIMVFTDGYTFSAASMFTKYLQYYGGGIVVGYFGYPNKDITFDSSLSPSGVVEISNLYLWNKNFDELLEKYKINIQFAIFQSYFDKDDLSVPLEYKVTPVDERISLYENFNESNYHIFVQKAKEIFAKYENNCNPNNTNLYLLDKDCVHGGFPCGEDGKWIKDKERCVQFYCDIGSIFDKKSGQCIPDNCSENDVYHYIIIILIVLSSLTILVMIFYGCVMCCCKKRAKPPMEENFI